jgi:hypothetical protein
MNTCGYRSKKHSHRPTWGNLIFDIIIPGIITFYLVSTEHAFIESFNEEMEILLYGEMLFLGFHTILTYFILPAIWFVDLMLFTGRFLSRKPKFTMTYFTY